MKSEADAQPQVLFVSDDLEMCQARLLALSAWNIGGAVEMSVEVAAATWAEGGFDLLIVDVHTLEFDGIAACRTLRGVSVNPMLLQDYGHDERDIISAYEAGVDEYIVKPIGLPLFRHKVKAWLRHAWTVPSLALRPREAAGLRLNPARRHIKAGDTVVRLSNLELRLLNLLMANEGRILPGDYIVARVWGYDDGDKAVLKNAIYRLRRKIEPEPGAPSYLHTISGEGYLFTSGIGAAKEEEPEGRGEL